MTTRIRYRRRRPDRLRVSQQHSPGLGRAFCFSQPFYGLPAAFLEPDPSAKSYSVGIRRGIIARRRVPRLNALRARSVYCRRRTDSRPDRFHLDDRLLDRPPRDPSSL